MDKEGIAILRRNRDGIKIQILSNKWLSIKVKKMRFLCTNDSMTLDTDDIIKQRITFTLSWKWVNSNILKAFAGCKLYEFHEVNFIRYSSTT